MPTLDLCQREFVLPLLANPSLDSAIFGHLLDALVREGADGVQILPLILIVQ